jgi:hypothetical protein
LPLFSTVSGTLIKITRGGAIISFGREKMKSNFLRKRRHPLDRRPRWLINLDEEIQYWLKNTARRRHSKPFNKTMRGYFRRQQKQFKAAQKEVRSIND